MMRNARVIASRRAVAAALAVVACSVAPAPAAAQDPTVSTVDLVQSQLTVPRHVTPGKRFIVLDTVENVGETRAPMTVTGFCLARTDTCTETDLKFAARRVPALPAGAEHAGESPLMLPDSVAPGDYFLVVTANANRDVQERVRENNVRASPLTVRKR
jgi:hypothetical protein